MGSLPRNFAMLNKRQFIRALGDVAVAGAVATSPMMAYAQKNRPPVDDVLAAYGGSEDSAAWRSQAAGQYRNITQRKLRYSGARCQWQTSA